MLVSLKRTLFSVRPARSVRLLRSDAKKCERRRKQVRLLPSLLILLLGTWFVAAPCLFLIFNTVAIRYLIQNLFVTQICFFLLGCAATTWAMAMAAAHQLTWCSGFRAKKERVLCSRCKSKFIAYTVTVPCSALTRRHSALSSLTLETNRKTIRKSAHGFDVTKVVCGMHFRSRILHSRFEGVENVSRERRVEKDKRVVMW